MRNKTFWGALLALILLLSAGCGSKPKDTDGQDEAAETPDFLGRVVLCGTTPTLGFEESSRFADCARARIAGVEKEYDCRFSFRPELTSSFSEVSAAIATGAIAADILYITPDHQSAMIHNGSFYDLLALSDQWDIVGHPEKWGNQNQLTAFVWNDALYAVLAMAYPETIYRLCDFAIYVNEKMVREELNLEDPREYVEKGAWDRKKFGELVSLYTHTENEEPVYGFCSHICHFFDITMKTSGIEYAVKSEDGTWSSGFRSPSAVSGFQWASDFLNVEHRNELRTGETYPMVALFCENRSAMLLTHSSLALYTIPGTNPEHSVARDVEDFGVLPFPLADGMPYGEWIGQYEGMGMEGICFQNNVNEPEELAVLLDAVYEPFDDYATEEDRLDYYVTSLFHDVRDAAVILKMLENCRYNFYAEGARGAVIDALASRSQKPAAEVLESTEKSYQKILEEAIVPCYESIEHIWGTQD